ncbi:MAG: tryptophan 2,3-dioxygenase family protein, partial [Anaerolineales bacterium]|nr:tryptophan 2,3-dioxygenase family protein [Anaerolineales bacterium]
LAESKADRECLRGNDDMHIRFMTPAHQNRMKQANLPELFEDVLRRRGINDVLQIYQGRGERRPQHDLMELADLLLEFDQFFQLWRVNHLVMVQSMIGRKSGTGHLGPEYLQETVGMGSKPASERLLDQPQSRPRFFERLWEARTELEGEVTVDGA